MKTSSANWNEMKAKKNVFFSLRIHIVWLAPALSLSILHWLKLKESSLTLAAPIQSRLHNARYSSVFSSRCLLRLDESKLFHNSHSKEHSRSENARENWFLRKQLRGKSEKIEKYAWAYEWHCSPSRGFNISARTHYIHFLWRVFLPNF